MVDVALGDVSLESPTAIEAIHVKLLGKRIDNEMADPKKFWGSVSCQPCLTVDSQEHAGRACADGRVLREGVWQVAEADENKVFDWAD